MAELRVACADFIQRNGQDLSSSNWCAYSGSRPTQAKVSIPVHLPERPITAPSKQERLGQQWPGEVNKIKVTQPRGTTIDITRLQIPSA